MIVCRWAFTILAFTNQRHGVAREDGRHVPRGTLGLEQEAAEASRAQWEDTERYENHFQAIPSYIDFV